MECRYVTRRKQNGRLDAGEFAFSLDNLMPIGIIGWYTLQPDEPEARMLACRRIESNDRDFLRDFAQRRTASRIRCVRGSRFSMWPMCRPTSRRPMSGPRQSSRPG